MAGTELDIKVSESLYSLFEDLDCMPEHILRNLHQAWAMHCADRERYGRLQIEDANKPRPS